MSRAPIMIGRMKFPNGPVTATISARIMMMPCIPTTALYVCGPRKFECDVISSVRIIIARVPPTPSRTMVRTRYWIPTTLWSVVNRK